MAIKIRVIGFIKIIGDTREIRIMVIGCAVKLLSC
jgi:hypothetical protein